MAAVVLRAALERNAVVDVVLRHPTAFGCPLRQFDGTELWANARRVFSLEQVSQLFQNRAILLAGWIHYGAFDLFVGYWETKDAQRLGIHHLLLVRCLLLTFLFGPAGLLAYLILRLTKGHKAT